MGTGRGIEYIEVGWLTNGKRREAGYRLKYTHILAMTADQYVRWNDAGVEHGAGAEEDKVIHDIEKQM